MKATAQNQTALKQVIALPPAQSDAISYAISQPDAVDMDDIVVRPARHG